MNPYNMNNYEKLTQDLSSLNTELAQIIFCIVSVILCLKACESFREKKVARFVLFTVASMFMFLGVGATSSLMSNTSLSGSEVILILLPVLIAVYGLVLVVLFLVYGKPYAPTSTEDFDSDFDNGKDVSSHLNTEGATRAANHEQTSDAAKLQEVTENIKSELETLASELETLAKCEGGDDSDLGNAIGIALEKTAIKHDSTMDKNDLIAGIEHGLKAARHGL